MSVHDDGPLSQAHPRSPGEAVAAADAGTLDWRPFAYGWLAQLHDRGDWGSEPDRILAAAVLDLHARLGAAEGDEGSGGSTPADPPWIDPDSPQSARLREAYRKPDGPYLGSDVWAGDVTQALLELDDRVGLLLARYARLEFRYDRDTKALSERVEALEVVELVERVAELERRADG